MPSNLLRCLMNAAFGSGLVNASAGLSSVRMNSGLMILFATSSRMKRSRLAMCLDRSHYMGSLETSIAAVLSMDSVVGSCCLM